MRKPTVHPSFVEPNGELSFLGRWPTSYPRHSGDWTLVGPGPSWARFDPEARAIEPIEPSHDPRLPGLGPALMRGKLNSYRVGRRATIATAAGFIKVVRPRRVRPIVQTHENLAGACPNLLFPAVVHADERGGIELTAVPGGSLHQLLRQSPTDRHRSAAIDMIGIALADLHATPAPQHMGPRPTDSPHRWITTVGRVEPAAVPELCSVAATLPSLPTDPSVVVHGDLHDKNIFISGPSVGLIDLDGVGLGNPADDVANLAVHLQLRGLQAGCDSHQGERAAERLYASYRTVAPLNEDRLHAVERHTWFRLSCLYRFRATSRHLVPEMLRRASVTFERNVGTRSTSVVHTFEQGGRT